VDNRADEEAVDAAVAALLAAYADVVTAMRAMKDPNCYFTRATELGETLRELVSKSTDERALAAERILEAESLSLTVLGQRHSMSRQRYDQLVKKGRKIREADDG
jgi:hypothetical protein